MISQKKLIKNTIIIAIGKICTQFLSFLLLPLYTSYLPTSDYGVVDLIVTYVSLLVPVITIQQEMAVFRFLVDTRGKKEESKKVISSSLSVVCRLLFAALIVGGIALLFIDIPYKILILVNIVTLTFSNFFLQIARGFGKNVQYSTASAIAGIVTILSNIVLIIFCHFGAESILISSAIANLLCAFYLFFALKIYSYISLKFSNRKTVKEMVKYSAPLVPNGISWWIINVSDRTIISAFISTAANGIYAMANKFPTIISSLFGIFGLSWTESASLHINDKDRDEYFSSVYNNSLKLFSCFSLGLIACMPFIFPIFIKEAYAESYLYIPILTLAAFFNCIVSIYSAIYVAKKMTKKVMNTSLISAGINLLIDLCLIKVIGVYAAALSTAVAYLTMAIYRHFDLKKYVKLRIDYKILVLSVVAFVLVFVAYYINNSVINMVSLMLVIVYSIVLNRKFIVSVVMSVVGKIFGKE